MNTQRRDVLKAVGGVVLVGGLAGCAGQGGETTTAEPTPEPTATPTETPTETAEPTATPEPETGMVRVAHASPDAPNVDVYVDGSVVLEDVPFRAVSDYLMVPVGPHTVTITAAGDAETVAFEGEVEVGSGAYTVAAIGELTSEDTEFGPLIVEDYLSDPGDDTARVTLVHASPDAPAVDVTVGDGETVLYDGVAFGETSTVEVPAGDYGLEIRGDTESNDGDVVTTVDVSLAGGAVYSAMALGYLTPDDEPTDEAFGLALVQNN
ncbi:protein of unknown function [Halogranum gelatinilyticum]|uniref:DUF4397 domain-containing protein n=1 Tax=Halogranum gelatinilyticum TaxID=660521 RepID=A0A1G9VHU5_9EURY|nr:DUF4397 domain-containing protein [Halogranum gelatinilyticum]SDM71653.1 protein of unknown function [Halogranum gelatinilyticum]